MAFNIEPEVSKWITQSSAFVIFFKAYDNSGRMCTGNQLSLQYSITYDGTMPSLTNMNQLTGDAGGLIFLNITGPCIISVYGKFAKDITDLSKGYTTQEIAINYEIDFLPNIASIQAKYAGSPVEITDEFDIHNTSIVATMTDKSVQIIDVESCTLLSDLIIDTVGDNIKEFEYYDERQGITWNINITVPGVIKLLSITAQYIGAEKIEGDRVYPSEITVTLEYIDTDGTKTRPLSEDEWYFNCIPIIMATNLGILYIRYETLDTYVDIPYEPNTSIYMDIWYEGPDVEVGQNFIMDNVVLMLRYPNREEVRLSSNDVTFSGTLVEKEGWNWYTITYRQDYIIYIKEFCVKGYIPQVYPDMDFKVVYVDVGNNYQETDFTEKFQEKFSYDDDVFIISWKNFLVEVNELMLYGLYIMTAPKLSGLSNQYDQDWEVLCIDKKTLKANVVKTYFKEEE